MIHTQDPNYGKGMASDIEVCSSFVSHNVSEGKSADCTRQQMSIKECLTVVCKI